MADCDQDGAAIGPGFPFTYKTDILTAIDWRNFSAAGLVADMPDDPAQVAAQLQHVADGDKYVKLLGQRLMSRDFDRQTAKLWVRIAIPKCLTSLGIPVTQPAS